MVMSMGAGFSFSSQGAVLEGNNGEVEFKDLCNSAVVRAKKEICEVLHR